MSFKSQFKHRFLNAGLLLFPVIFLVFACKTEENLEFAPTVDPKATYIFTINNPNGTVGTKYTLTDLTQVANTTAGSNGQANYTFLLKGTDKETRQVVCITGRTSLSNHDLNIAITQGTSTTFFKDCNSLYWNVTTGTDSRGKFIKLNNSGSTCITPTLASERTMNIVQYNTYLSPITLYLQGE